MRYAVYRFDNNAFVVIDTKENCEICICANYDDKNDADIRAKMIVGLLNTFK